MAFEIQIVGAEELSGRHLLTQVVVDRPLYDHTRAELTLHWHEGSLYEDRQTAFLAAKLLNCPIDIQWKDNDLTEHVTCFHGYIEDVRGHRDASSSSLFLSCVSFSRRTDLIPRFRTFQATTLLEIATQIAKSEPLIKIDNAGDLDLPIVLSVQHGETDFAYLTRMLHAWAVPMMISDKTGQVILGARGAETRSPFPDSCYGWSEISFSGTLEALPYLSGGGAGPVGLAQSRVQAHNSELSRKAAYYYGIPDAPAITKRVSEAASKVDTSGYHLVLNGAVLSFSPGDVVSFEGQQHLVRKVRVTGHPQQTTATQEFYLQPLTLPLAPERERPVWSSRALWSHVTANEHDPLHQGRIQVEFEWEHLDPQASHQRAWLHTLTPYGGGSGGANSTGYTGFYSIPEVGERVLVEFLGDWDSEAVVIGGIREGSVPDAHNQKRTKRWRTPEGNAIAMHSNGPTSNVRMETKNKIMMATEVGDTHNSVTVINGSHAQDILHIEREANFSRLYLNSNNIMNIGSGGEIHIVSEHITVTATKDLQFRAEAISFAAAKDFQIAAGGQIGIFSQGDMAVASDKGQALFGAKGNVQIESVTATTRVSGSTTEVSGKQEVHVEGGLVHVNTTDGKLADLPAPKTPVIPAPPDGPPAPTFHTPFS
ncbi:MAG: phage baseplate assembly protein V [Janthinobacterium lividum]